MKQLILAEREASGMTSTWDEFLCVSLNEDRTFCVYTGRREVLAEASEYYNEETDEYEVPEEIDGQAVWGVKDDCVVSEAVGNFDDEPLRLTDFDAEAVRTWLEDTDWIHDASPADLQQALLKLKAKRG
jgi:hypothetical protein